MKNFNEKWIELLTAKKVDKLQEFQEILSNSKCESLAIMKYRRELINSGVGQSITSKDLQLCSCKEESYLQETLQNLFLEPVSMNNLKFIYKQIIKKGYSIEEGLDKLYQRHMEEKTLRLLSVLQII